MKVLMIDDNELDLLISRKLISKQVNSLEFTEYNNATEALQHLAGQEENDFDIILLDLNMPEMNGWDFLEEYRKLPVHKANVYILTSSLDTRDKLRSKEYEAVKGYFDKPLKSNYIAEIVAFHQIH
ncbi:CheY-like chemotaxis protein [Catalinimonas alkaloidigena]|uniref:response regulator n=1 Tax=Catalinimonas alkaloidigena TaxID=1075417 RepID=UPI0024068C13|nr:response regulator [Catalinimonas alkaloidigena]MDF9799737.1 CheY-like chemotaxis protein [Catalinimonas alkaloidigena]